MKDTKIFCFCSNNDEVILCNYTLNNITKKNKNVEYIPLYINDKYDNDDYCRDYLCEISSLLYLYEHQTLLGDAKYIGLCHYRRIYNNLTDDYIDFLSQDKSNYICGEVTHVVPNDERSNIPIIDTIFNTHREKTRISIIDLINSFIKLCPYYTNMYMDFEDVKEWDLDTPIRNMFILNRDEFIKLCIFYYYFTEYMIKETTGRNFDNDSWEYFIKYKCLQIDRFDDDSFNPFFGDKKDIKDINAPIPPRTMCKRHFAYLTEYITAWYLLKMLGKNYKVCTYFDNEYEYDWQYIEKYFSDEGVKNILESNS